MSNKHPSPYDDLKLLVAEKPRAYGPLDALDDLNRSIAGYKKMPKGRDDQRVDAKIEFFNIIDAFDKATPEVLKRFLRMDDLAAGVVGDSMSNLASAVQHQQHAQQQALWAEPENKDALRAHYADGMQHIKQTIYDARFFIQPKRPRIMHEPEVLKQVHVDLYAPFVRAFAASTAADRATKQGRHILAQLPHLDQVAREVQGVVAMLDFSDSLERFDKKLKQRAEQSNVHVNYYWQEHRDALQPYLTKLCDQFDETIRAIELENRPQPAGYKTTPAYAACIHAKQTLRDLKYYKDMQLPRDEVKHYAFEYILGGEDIDIEERHHKLVHRIEDAYHADLALFNQRLAAEVAAHNKRMDRSPHAEIGFEPPSNPLQAPLHMLHRVYDARWAMIADEMVTLIGQSKTLDNPDVVHPSEKPPLEVDVPHVMTKRQFAALQRRAQKGNADSDTPPQEGQVARLKRAPRGEAGHAAHASSGAARGRAELPPESARRDLAKPDTYNPDLDHDRDLDKGGWNR